MYGISRGAAPLACRLQRLAFDMPPKRKAGGKAAASKQRQQSFAELSVLPTISKPVSINKEVFEPSLEAIKARYYAKFSKGGKVPEEAAEEEYVLAPTSGGEAGPALAPAPAPAHTPAASPTRRSPRRASAPAPPQPLGLETLLISLRLECVYVSLSLRLVPCLSHETDTDLILCLSLKFQSPEGIMRSLGLFTTSRAPLACIRQLTAPAGHRCPYGLSVA